MNIDSPTCVAGWGLIALLGVMAGCATPPQREIQVVSMGSQAPGADPGSPPPGTIWRLEESEFEALGPVVPAPDVEEAKVPPAIARSYPYETYRQREYGYVVVPSIVYFGSHFGFAWGYPRYWPRYYYPYRAPHSRWHSRPWRERRR